MYVLLAMIMKKVSKTKPVKKIVILLIKRSNMLNTSKIIPHFLQSNVLHSEMCDVKHSTITKPVLRRKMC